MGLVGRLAEAMVAYEAGDVHRINHFMKVYGFARMIGELEALDAETQLVLELAALTHDIGIRPSMEKYGNADGPNQEKEGPPVAQRMLADIGCTGPVAERVCWLIGHHHSYEDIRGADYQILVEADFLVNIHEGGMQPQAVDSVREKIFKTAAGTAFLDRMFRTDRE